MMRFGLNCLPIGLAYSFSRSNNSKYVLPRLFGKRQDATGSPTKKLTKL
ncbi:unnamed protein product, partial [Rotaria magnacalcarata]